MFRQVAEESEFAPVAEVSGHEWIDTHTSYGTRYRYRVMAVSKTPHGEAVSDLSAPVEIAPQDRYPPDPPGRLTAVASTASIELAWEPSAGAVSYGVDRAAGNGSWERIGSVAAPAYSDHPPESGKTYRYAVTARDASGNESARSEAAEVAAP
jgi:fibronectin type 3 domain-containing protein